MYTYWNADIVRAEDTFRRAEVHTAVSHRGAGTPDRARAGAEQRSPRRSPSMVGLLRHALHVR